MNMRKWSAAKLAKEACFARACREDSPESSDWADRVEAEVTRRYGSSPCPECQRSNGPHYRGKCEH
jgi:hypothetical protein